MHRPVKWWTYTAPNGVRFKVRMDLMVRFVHAFMTQTPFYF